jgi:hydrogenase maturation protease
VKILVLGLGNDLLADDAVGILAVQTLKEQIGDEADVIASSVHGLGLLDLFVGYDRAILIDAIQTGRFAPGTIFQLNSADLEPVYAPSPHYAGLPEMLRLSRQLELDFPEHFTIFAVEVADAHTINGTMTKAVRDAVPELCRCVRSEVLSWSRAHCDC